MIFHLCCWLLVGVPCILLGELVEHLTGDVRFTPRPERLIMALFLGLGLLSSFLLALSLLTPVTPVALGFILGLTTIVALSRQALRKEIGGLCFTFCNLRVLVLFVIFAMLGAYAAADPIKIYDTGVYHYPLVRWLATTGTIPGLALLYGNFGFTSSWFALTAALDHGFFQGRVAGVFSGLAAFTAILHFGIAASRILGRRGSKADWFLLGAYPVVFAFWYQMNYHTSPSPDLPVLVLLVLIAWRMLAEEESGGRRDSFRSNLPLLILAGATVDLKLSAAPILGITSLAIAVRCRFALRHVIPALLTAMVFSAPLLIANVITSGYPLYPAQALGTRFPWTVPGVEASAIAEVVKNAAYCNGPCAQAVVGWNWVIPWLHNPQNLAMLFVSVLAPVIFFFQKDWKFGRATTFVLVLAEGGVLYVLLTVPNVRFAIGYVALCSGLCLTLLVRKKRSSTPWGSPHAPLAFGIATLIGLSFLADSYVGGRSHSNFPGAMQLIVPQALPARSRDVATFKNRHVFRDVTLTLASETADGFTYCRPVDGEQCWAANLPCVPGGLKRGIVLRDPLWGFRGGFVETVRGEKQTQVALDRHH